MSRVPKKDDVLPLSKPILGVSGKVYKELSIPAGTFVSMSAAGYNLCVHPLDLFPRVLRSVSLVAGTRTCGGPTLMSSDRNDGSIRMKSVIRRLGFMVTCA